MKKVFIYKFRGTYSGGSDYDYHAPVAGHTHSCLIFIAQESAEIDTLSARNEIGRFGFVDLESVDGKRMSVESLNTQMYQGFSGFYEEALREGSSLVYYPNT
ncbi:hypothetical protein [Teredinibacter purpureus]|uniref:hypothetical protein n=1 Tax=Teredinibacter purpureus TaxID=2731756 RepID=UPI0005F88124|nr:hypothetical protein [Teredinibacter purpureus]